MHIEKYAVCNFAVETLSIENLCASLHISLLILHRIMIVAAKLILFAGICGLHKYLQIVSHLNNKVVVAHEGNCSQTVLEEVIATMLVDSFAL